MLSYNTPIEDHRNQFGLWVKREDLSCAAPPFSKTRGVFAHVRSRPEEFIGVLDTYHSQGGWAVARACQSLNKKCINFYPIRKADRDKPLQPQQIASRELGAKMVPLPAGRSAILYHNARRVLAEMTGQRGVCYMMPNALKLPEMVEETAEEVQRTLTTWTREPKHVIISISSGTIAAGVIKGFRGIGYDPHFILHQGYSRPREATLKYISHMGGINPRNITLIDEGYSYGDVARGVIKLPPWPSNKFYDLKAFQWWIMKGREEFGEALLWNIG